MGIHPRDGFHGTFEIEGKTMSKVRLNNVTREAALASLFNRAKPQGLGMLQYDKAHVMTEREAGFVLMNGDYVDYLEGRVIKVDSRTPKKSTRHCTTETTARMPVRRLYSLRGIGTTPSTTTPCSCRSG